MPYSRNNYNFVIDSSFRPYTQEEILKPLIQYKEAFDKMESGFSDYADKFEKYKEYAKQNPESEAANIYNGYANDFNSAFNNFLEHGLPGSRRALMSLKKRYQSEIGRLDAADKVLQEVLKSRRDEKDSSMLYGTKNLTIDQFLDGKTPNMYRISGNELADLGEKMGKAVSSRIYNYEDAGSIFGGQYNIFKETQGIRPEDLNNWMATAGNELADRILIEKGVPQNLSEEDCIRAKQTVLNNIYKGIVYNENTKPYDNGEYMSKAQRDASNRGWANFYLDATDKGYSYDKKTGTLTYNSTRDNRSKPKDSTDLSRFLSSDMKKLKENNFEAKSNELISSFGPNPSDFSITKVSTSSTNKMPPLFVNAWHANAKRGFDIGESGDFYDTKDAKKYSIDRVQSEEAKQQLRDYVAEIFPDVVDGLTNEEIDKVINKMTFTRDEDHLSRSHFRLSFPGVEDDGTIKNQTLFRQFLTDVNRIKWEAYNNRFVNVNEPTEVPKEEKVEKKQENPNGAPKVGFDE